MTQPSTYNFTPLEGYENFEATTQIIIAEILKRNLKFEVIEGHENLIIVHYKDKEYIIFEGTISDANSIIAFWISNDKWMTKTFLKRADINHAEAVLINKGDKLSDNLKLKYPLVVKPFDTDHGIAVSTNLKTFNDVKDALTTAFQHSEKAIIEQFYEGFEYRFLVIDYKVRAIAYRIPANVIGDGKSTIQSLINQKNSYRGDDYTTPLLKIKVDKEVTRQLQSQGLSLDSVPKKDEQIFLRKNSNLSTGGDSIDITDEMPEDYKKIAEKAAKSASLKIAGIDIIIKDINQEPNKDNHIVVELNAPAMLSMHDYPYVGKNRNVAKYVLDVILASK